MIARLSRRGGWSVIGSTGARQDDGRVKLKTSTNMLLKTAMIIEAAALVPLYAMAAIVRRAHAAEFTFSLSAGQSRQPPPSGKLDSSCLCVSFKFATFFQV